MPETVHESFWDPQRTPYVKFLRSPETEEMFYGQYPDLWEKYGNIFEQGLLSQDQITGLMGDYRSAMAPGFERRRAEHRGRVSADVSGRMGSRSGASQKAISNLVDLPSMRQQGEEESKFLQGLKYRNLMSRFKGLEGQKDLWGAMMGGQANLADLYYRVLQYEIDQDEGGSGFADMLGEGSKFIATYAARGG